MPAGQAAVIARKKQQNRAKKLAAKAAAKEAAIDDWFKKYDKSGTGTMSREEMREVLTAFKRDATHDPNAVVREDLLDQVMNYADVSKDGEIEPQHLLAAIKKYKSLMSETDHLLKLFQKHDSDHSGDLDKAQLLSLLQEAAPPPHRHADESDAEFILERCDVNHTGTITWGELQPAIATWMEIATETPPEKEGGGSSACVLL